MNKTITPIKINKKNFSKFGDIISTKGLSAININNGYAKRFDNIANLDTKKKKW